MATVDSLPRDSDGKLSSYAWPGGYPLYYLTEGDNILCPDCANANDDEDDTPETADVNWEDPDLYCDECGERIESAYAEKED